MKARGLVDIFCFFLRNFPNEGLQDKTPNNFFAFGYGNCDRAIVFPSA